MHASALPAATRRTAGLLLAGLLCAPAVVGDPNDPNCPCVTPSLPPGDCNLNGVADSDDIASGTSFDLNANGIPDECELCVSVEQISWANGLGGFNKRFTSIGELTITTIEPPDGEVLWVNAAVDGVHVLQNLPLIQLDRPGDTHTYTLYFDLGNVIGTPLTGARVSVQLGRTPWAAPPTLPPELVPVCENPAFPGLDFDPNFPDPNLPDPNFGPGPGPRGGKGKNKRNPPPPPGEEKVVVARRQIRGVNEDKNHCVPGAYARSLDWMNRIYCLGFPESCDDPQEIYDKLRMRMMTSRTNGTTRSKGLKGASDFIRLDKELGNCLMVKADFSPDPCEIIDALAAGKDVIGYVGWIDAHGNRKGGHAMTIVGGVKCGDKVTIYVREDALGKDKQDGKAADTDTKEFTFTKKGSRWEIDGLGVGRNRWEGIVSICATRKKQADAAGKLNNPDPSGGDPNDPTGDPNDPPPMEGIQPRLERWVLGGEVPLPEELDELLDWSEDLVDVARYLRGQLALDPGSEPFLPPASFGADLAQQLRAVVRQLRFQFDPPLAQFALQLAQQIGQVYAQLSAGFDCDGNGIDDHIDILNGDLPDTDGDGIPDLCDCAGDTDGDFDVDLDDLLNVLAAFGAAAGDPAYRPGIDQDGDGTIDLDDLLLVLANFAAPCGG